MNASVHYDAKALQIMAGMSAAHQAEIRVVVEQRHQRAIEEITEWNRDGADGKHTWPLRTYVVTEVRGAYTDTPMVRLTWTVRRGETRTGVVTEKLYFHNDELRKVVE